MQRLFSTLAEGPPGAGLLIQRVLVGAALLYCAVATPSDTFGEPQVIGALAGVLLIAGLWQPVAGSLRNIGNHLTCWHLRVRLVEGTKRTAGFSGEMVWLPVVDAFRTLEIEDLSLER